jgi:hypothetical protein
MSGSTYYRVLSAAQMAELQAAQSETSAITNRMECLGLRIERLDNQMAKNIQKGEALRDDILALEAVLSKVESSRRQIIAAQEITHDVPSKVADVNHPDLANLRVVESESDAKAAIFKAAALTRSVLVEDVTELDFSGTLGDSLLPPKTATEFLQRGIARVRALVPLTAEETQRHAGCKKALEEALAKIVGATEGAGLAATAATAVAAAADGAEPVATAATAVVAAVVPAVDGELLSLDALEYRFGRVIEDICRDMGEEDSEIRRNTLLTYLALCELCDTVPRSLNLARMQDAISEMTSKMLSEQQEQQATQELTAALQREGYNLVRVSNLNGNLGNLYAKDTEDCGIFVCKQGEGFLFTTTTDVEVSKASTQKRAQMMESVKNICSLKGRITKNLAEQSDLKLEQLYDLPPELECTSYSEDFALLRKQQAEQRRSLQIEAAGGSRQQQS